MRLHAYSEKLNDWSGCGNRLQELLETSFAMDKQQEQEGDLGFNGGLAGFSWAWACDRWRREKNALGCFVLGLGLHSVKGRKGEGWFWAGPALFVPWAVEEDCKEGEEGQVLGQHLVNSVHLTQNASICHIRVRIGFRPKHKNYWIKFYRSNEIKIVSFGPHAYEIRYKYNGRSQIIF